MARARSPEAPLEQENLRIAIPAKGRLREPSVALLEDAGLAQKLAQFRARQAEAVRKAELPKS